MLPSFVSAEGGQTEQAREAEAITYRVRSSARVLEAPTDALRLKGIATREGKGLWVVHELSPEEAPGHCGEAGGVDAMEYLQER